MTDESRQQDARISALIDDIVAAASGALSLDVQDVADELHEYITEIRAASRPADPREPDVPALHTDCIPCRHGGDE